MIREGFGLIQNQRPENMTGFITAEEDLSPSGTSEFQTSHGMNGPSTSQAW